MSKKAIITDLDGTLLHPEPAEYAVQGQSVCQYISRKTVEWLTEISRKIPVIIATGRNARSVSRLTDQLKHITFSGFVLENGMIARSKLFEAGLPADRWTMLYQRFPGWKRLKNYESCLAMIAPASVNDPKAEAGARLNNNLKSLHIYREGQKIFVYPRLPGKFAGIRTLNFEPYIVLGDEINDMDMLWAGEYPGTIASACKEVLRYVHTSGGYCSRFSSHAGTEDLLKWAAKTICSGNANI